MPSASSRDFYANALGIAKGSLSINDLKLMFFRSVSSLPVNTGSVSDNEFDYYRLKAGLPAGSGKTLNDLKRLYYKSLGINTDAEFERGVMTVRTNYSWNNSFTVTNVGWNISAGGAQVRTTAEFSSAPASLQVTPAALGDGAQELVANTGTLPLLVPTTISCKVKTTAAALMRIQAAEFTPPSTAQGSTQNDFAGTGAWQTVSVVKTPVDVGNVIRPVISTQDPAFPIFYVDDVLIEQVNSVGSFFNGETPGARWLGIVNGSNSQLTAWSA